MDDIPVMIKSLLKHENLGLQGQCLLSESVQEVSAVCFLVMSLLILLLRKVSNGSWLLSCHFNFGLKKQNKNLTSTYKLVLPYIGAGYGKRSSVSYQYKVQVLPQSTYQVFLMGIRVLLLAWTNRVCKDGGKNNFFIAWNFMKLPFRFEIAISQFWKF